MLAALPSAYCIHRLQKLLALAHLSLNIKTSRLRAQKMKTKTIATPEKAINAPRHSARIQLSPRA
jgi:hypothetical protein